MSFNWKRTWRRIRPGKSVVHFHTVCWNEALLLPYFFRHYDSFVDRYFFYDDNSTDATPEIIKSHPRAELRPFPRSHPDSFVLSSKQFYDNCWKESRGRADWVLVAMVDEFNYHPDMPGYLNRCRRQGVTLIPAIGHQMLSYELPREPGQLPQMITKGARLAAMNKLCLFNPDRIREVDFEVGNHVAHPAGRIVYPERDELLLLHYKYLSFDWTLERHRALEEKLGNVDRENRWGFHYTWSKEKLRKSWGLFEAEAVDNVLLPCHREGEAAARAPKLWWRQ